VEHVQPLQRSFPWRAAALVAVVLAAAELVALVALDGGRLYHALRHATSSPASTQQRQTRPATVARHVPAGPATPLRPRSHVSVLVLNGNGISGAAGAEATRLLAHGYGHARATNAAETNYARSVVLFRPGWEREAERLARDARAKVVSPLDGRLPAGSGHPELVLILGR
jgi:LytR cell envelope-related transcriptional attenuator